MRQSKRNRIVFIVIVISIIVALGIIGLFKSGAMIQKDYKKSVRYKKLKYLSYKLEDHYNKKILCSSGIKGMPYEYQIKKNGKLYGTLIDEYGYPLKKYGHVMKEEVCCILIIKTDYMEWGGIVLKNFRLKCQKIKEIM